MPIRLISSDEPPELTNGSGMPFVGSSPSTTLMLKNAWNATIVVRPIARNAPKRSGARIAVRRPRHVITQKQARTIGRADQPELLGDHRVDEVVVRLGQVEELLHAAHQPAAEDAAGADRDHRLDHLEAVAERIVPGIEERDDALPAVFRRHQTRT